MKKFNEYTPAELREISRKGGVNSGIARRRKKAIREFLTICVEVIEEDYNYGRINGNGKDKQLSRIRRELKRQGYICKKGGC